MVILRRQCRAWGILLGLLLTLGTLGDAISETTGTEKPAATQRVIVAFGDSLTAGLGVPVEQAYPARLEQRLRDAGYDYRVINAGVSSDTTAGGLRRVDAVLSHDPEIVILELGANDGLRGQNLTHIRDNLAQLIERIQASGSRVILAGMKLPPNYGPQYTDGFTEIYETLAATFDLTLMPFFWTAWRRKRN